MKSVRVYPYRWIVLAALMAVIMASEMQWLALAPISRAAGAFYSSQIPADSLIGPDLLTLIHLVVFVFFSLPASYIIDKVGLKWTLRSSAILLAVFSIVKGLGAASFWTVVVSQIGLSVAHALILNNVTLVTARWFPLRERGFATGLVSFAQYLGLLLIMILSPQLVVTNPHMAGYGEGIPSLLFWLGLATATGAFAVLFFFKEKPPTPSSMEPFENESFFTSFKLLLHKKHMGGFITIFGLVWGLFNVFIAKIDSITAFIGVQNSNGIVGLILLGAGMLGSVVVPLLSDYLRKRKLFFFICMAGILVGVLVFASIPLLDEFILSPVMAGFIAAGILGFFFQSAIPLGYQYASELSFPVQEASSQGVLLLNGHFIGIIILIFMNLEGGRFLEPVLIISVALLFAAVLAVLFIKESPIIVTEDERLREAVDKESVRQS
ncbi:MAG: MFS transporter [Sphaerochaeta sp.]|nr:MFS transporter [Sphaerochaeta sp.]